MKEFLNGVVKKAEIRRFCVGLFLALISLISGFMYGQVITGIQFALMFVFFGYIKFDFKNDKLTLIATVIWTVITMYSLWYITTMMVVTPYTVSINSFRLTLNMLCIAVVTGFVYIFVPNLKRAMRYASVALFMLALINGFVYQFRGKEFVFTDVLSINTAFNVMGQYKPSIHADMFFGFLLFALVFFIQFSIKDLEVIHKKRRRVGAAILIVVATFAIFNASEDIRIRTWETEGTRINGYYLNLLLGIRDSIPDKPDNYSTETIQEIADKYDEPEKKENYPNVIVIMSESYTDFRVLGDEYETNIPVMPYWDSLTENTIKGYALSSVYGGMTADSEFEFLTSHSLSHFPSGSVPYQQYIRKKVYALPWLMRDLGYESISTHPFWANGWSRKRIYPYLGFTKSTFLEDYPEDATKYRDYVSDRVMYERMIEDLKNKEEGKPLFYFGVTMQNHGGFKYEGDNYQKTVEIKGCEGQYPLADQYLSIINESDKSLEYLITELENYPEDTVLLIFGDHYPKVETKLYERIHGGPFENIQEKMLQYTVPFMIWANYDIPEQTIEKTSLNYLAKHLLEAAGIPLPEYYSFISEVEEKFPSMNAYGYYSKEEDRFISFEEIGKSQKRDEHLEIYNSLSYNNIFDLNNRNFKLFGKYIE